MTDRFVSIKHLGRLTKYFDYIDPKYPAYIVGGAAVDYELAGDVDMLLISKEDPTKDLVKDIPGFEPNPNFWHRYEEGFYRLLCGEVELLPKKMQILVDPSGPLEQVLLDFDVSTHQVGVDRIGNIYTVITTTPINQQPRVRRWSSPKATLARYNRVCDRYGLKPNGEDVVKLEELILEKEEWEGRK